MEDANIYSPPEKKVLVTCHTAHERTPYEPGKQYLMMTEVIGPYKDTKDQECILCWVFFDEKLSGSRFAVKGNIYINDRPYWPDFKKHFECPVAKKREARLLELMD